MPSTLHAQIVPRVQRFLSGDRRIDDLDRIFLALRARSFGNWFVRDVGDFAAHTDERDKGFIWAAATVQAGKMGLMLLDDELWPIDRYIAVVAGIIAASEDVEIQQHLGISKKKAAASFKALSERMSMRPDGGLAIDGGPTASEEKLLLHFTTGSFTVGAVMNKTGLADQLASVLEKNGLIAAGDSYLVHAQADYLAVYAGLHMHLVQLSMPQLNNSGQLRLGVESGNLVVRLLTKPGLKDVTVASPIFSLDVPAAQWVEKDLASAQGCDLDVPLELGPEGKVRKL